MAPRAASRDARVRLHPLRAVKPSLTRGRHAPTMRARRVRLLLFLGATHELERGHWVDRFTWRAVDAGIVVAHGAARWYAAEGFGPPAKMHVLWKGVDLARFDRAHAERARKRAELGLASDEL